MFEGEKGRISKILQLYSRQIQSEEGISIKEHWEYVEEISQLLEPKWQELLLQCSKGAHLDSSGYYWHFEIPRDKLKEVLPNVNW